MADNIIPIRNNPKQDKIIASIRFILAFNNYALDLIFF